MALAIHIETQYTVIVLNDSDQAIESFVLSGPAVQVELGPIAARRKVRRRFRFSQDGELIFYARQDGVPFNGVVDRYVTNDMGGRTIVRVKGKGVYVVEQKGL